MSLSDCWKMLVILRINHSKKSFLLYLWLFLRLFHFLSRLFLWFFDFSVTFLWLICDFFTFYHDFFCDFLTFQWLICDFSTFYHDFFCDFFTFLWFFLWLFCDFSTILWFFLKVYEILFEWFNRRVIYCNTDKILGHPAHFSKNLFDWIRGQRF